MVIYTYKVNNFHKIKNMKDIYIKKESEYIKANYFYKKIDNNWVQLPKEELYNEILLKNILLYNK